MTKDTFKQALLEFGVQVNEEQLAQFEKYMNLLIEWN